jgi:phage FluMu protein Com
MVKKYLKIIPCIFCEKDFEVIISKTSGKTYSQISQHGFLKRKCPHCLKTWRVSSKKSFLINKL